MKRLLYYLPAHFCVGLLLGICVQYYFKIWQLGFTLLAILLFLLLLFFAVSTQKIIRTFLAFFLFFSLGLSLIFVNNAKNHNNYYQYKTTVNSYATLQVVKVLKSDLYYHKYEAKVTHVDDITTKGKVLLQIQKDTTYKPLNVDDVLYAKPQFRNLLPSLNPHQFDYRNYLQKRGIHQQVVFKSSEYLLLNNQQWSFLGIASDFRESIQKALEKYNFKKDNYAVMNALLLGQRQEISKDLIADYSNAGAIHILAVSGLHVGIVLLILTWCLKPFDVLKNGKIIKVILIILALWSFAFIAGLSASVVRAVTMFTFVALGMLSRKKNIVAFSLISSFFLLLVVNPMFLFDVGFQLSYLAVFGIIWVQPKLYTVWKTKYKVFDFFWQLITVSIAAQIGILPLSLYYFHQLPGLFLLTNLVIIPFLGAILVGGFLVIALALVNQLPQVVADFYNAILSLLNGFVQWVSDQEAFIFNDLSLSLSMMILWYALIFSFVFLCVKFSFKRLVFFCLTIISLQIGFAYEVYQTHSKSVFIIFHKSRTSVFGERNAEQFTIHHRLEKEEAKSLRFLKAYKVSEKVQLNYIDEKRNVYQFKDNHIVIVDSLGVYQIKGLQNPIVVLQDSPKLNLERLILTLQPKHIIADGSNYKSYIHHWKNKAKQLGTPFYVTGEKGAFVLLE